MPSATKVAATICKFKVILHVLERSNMICQFSDKALKIVLASTWFKQIRLSKLKTKS